MTRFQTMKEPRRLIRAVGMAALLATAAARTAGATNCTIGYPFSSSEPRTNVAFNESAVLRAFSPEGTAVASPGLTIKVWYNDEHAMTLGVRRVTVKTSAGTTSTDYPVAPLPASPSAVANPQVGTTALDGDQAGTDTASCAGYPDRCDRPMFPALFLTDITSDPSSRAGDWQMGGTPIPPHAVFGTWKSAVRTVDKTHSPAVVTVTPDADPVKNDWNLAGGDAPPSGLNDEGYGAEVRWNVDDLVAAGLMIKGHTYRLQFMVHDGDQNQNGGDTGENCVNVNFLACATAADCDDNNACTTDTCDANVCYHTTLPDCRPCTTDGDCDDQNACTTESCSAGICHYTTLSDCRPCTTAADCDDGNSCTTDACDAGVCSYTTLPGCQSCITAADCNDGNGCTNDICTVERVCQHQNRPGCVPCATAADCNDGNPCTDDQCSADGSCAITTIPGCKRCNTAAECDDGDACTIDGCVAGVCMNRDIPGCGPEICDDGIDNDGNGLVDCNDPACFDSPVCKRPPPPTEICDNCIDDDGNGLTDFEDPACCLQSETFSMELNGGHLRPVGNGTALRLRTLLARTGLSVNPLEDEVVLQIRPEGGLDTFCAVVPPGKFMNMNMHHPNVFKFWDHAHTVPSAEGIDDLKIKLARDGSVHFWAYAKHARMSIASPGRLQVTVGFRNPAAGDGANRCSSSVQEFRAGRKGLLRTP